MNNQTRISIAMAVYNGQRFIREQLDSFVTQTRLPDELVVSDNASTDSTLEIVREFASRAPFPVRIFKNDSNLGVSKNFERAIRECTGDIIFLSDCDDVWYPKKIESLELALDRFPQAGFAVSNSDLINEHLSRLGLTLWESVGFSCNSRLQRKLAQGGYYTRSLPTYGNSMAFRSKLRTQGILPLPDITDVSMCPHDIFIAWVIICSGLGGAIPIAEPLLAYRQHDAQITWRSRRSHDGDSESSLFAQRFAGRGQRPTITLGPIISRLETLATHESANQKLLSAVVRHWRKRCEMPRSRLARVPVVLSELVSLRYWRFSAGITTAAKDLIFVR